MDSTLLRAKDSSSHLIKSGDPSCGAIVNSKLSVTNANQLKFTRPARPVQVHKSAHSVIYSSKYPDGKSFDNTSDSDDNICSYCNVGVVENNFTFAGVLLCVICFPFGFAWLFCMMESQCPHCGKIYL